MATLMTAAVAGSVYAVASSAGGLAGDGALETTPVRTCSSAIYTAPIRRGMTPRAVNAIVVGAAIFNDLKGARSYLAKPTKAVRFWTYKSPLTVWARPIVRVSVGPNSSNARLLYTENALRNLSKGRVSLSSLPRAILFQACAADHGRLRLATQYNGGIALRRPGCVTIRVDRLDGQGRVERVVPFGVRKC